MITGLLIFSSILIVLSVLPFIQNQHWVFRVAEFIKLQLLPLQIVVFIVTLFYVKENSILWYFQVVQLACIGYHIYILSNYFAMLTFIRRKWLTLSALSKQTFNIVSTVKVHRQFHNFVNRKSGAFNVITSSTDTKCTIINTVIG